MEALKTWVATSQSKWPLGAKGADVAGIVRVGRSGVYAITIETESSEDTSDCGAYSHDDAVCAGR